MSGDLRVGLVGCGAMGEGHLRAWDGIPGARVSAVCDPVPGRAAQVAGRLGAHGYATLEAMLDAAVVDAVDICTPSGLHAEHGLMAARHGLHVLCEKPLDLDPAKASRLVDECERRGLILACIFQRRTHSGARQVAAEVAEGRLGSLISCSAYVKWWRAQSYYDSSSWRGTRDLDGGVLANQAIHAIDHMCWLAGPVAAVEYASVETRSHRMEAEDQAIAVLRFASGARGVIEATTCCSPDLCTRLEVYGTRGSAAFDDANVVSYGYDGQDRLASVQQDCEPLGGRSDPMAISLRGHGLLFADFVAAVADGSGPLVSGREALLSVDALHRICCAGRAGKSP